MSCSAGVCDALSAIRCLEHENLNSDEELKDRLLQLNRCLSEGHYGCLLRNLLSPPPTITRPALELVLACTECGRTFTRWLENCFPSSPEKYPVSLHASILDRLSLSLLFSFTFEREIVSKLTSYRPLVEFGPRAIKALIQIDRSFTRSELQDTEEFAEFAITSFVKVQRTQRRRKDAKSAPKPRFDTKTIKALQVYGIDTTYLDCDLNHEILAVLNTQRDMFKTYLELLQSPEVESSIREAYLLCEQEMSNDSQGALSAQNTKDAYKEELLIPSIVPPAYPMVQPMKAALYFDSADGFGQWRILISTRANRDLREARRKDTKFLKIIIKKIKELSNGYFSADNQKRLNGRQTDIPIYEAKMTRDSRLIYQIDCLPEYNADVERQVIKIFGVYTHAQIDQRLWDSIGHQLGKRGKEYKQRCLFRNHPLPGGGDVFMPACFPPIEETEEEDQSVPELPRENLEEIHTLLVLDKFVPFSQVLLNSIIADLDVAHVFDVSPQEKAIIEYPYSCYVLGRSGTGKTTTMLFKMLGIERAYVMRKDSMQKPRQLFVTQSRVLAGKVEDYFTKLLDSLATAGKSKEELAQFIKIAKLPKAEDDLVDVDDDHDWRNDLPQKFSELQDEHFPLFLTFDRLASLLEADISSDTLGTAVMPMECGGDSTRGMKLINYRTFLDSYWPHFSQNLKKGLDPTLVYNELIGVIQGSEESLNYAGCFLDKTAYENLSHRAQYAFASRRDVIYSIFLLYLKQKRARNEYDAADRTHFILKAIEVSGLVGQKIDFLYVDEAQDNLLIDAFLLRSLVRNPDGLFWAGDTAQTISVGSSFRFNDLKAFLFRLEKRREMSFSNSPVAHAQEPPLTFQLIVNYRSHGGIVQCAHSVIELITEFWPHAIDILSKEKGVVEGSKPVFFSGWDGDTVRYEQFLFGESGSPIEFGAQQCILVRDEAARDALRQEVGDIGLILTLYESKGLEFDDVLLYKFFEDSSLELSQWRVVLNLLSDQPEGQSFAPPRFDELRHAGICSELKFLYVAITRARKNLWIVDCSEKGEPMRILWTARNEVQNCTPGTDVPRLAVSSSPQEWERSGRTLFQNKRYLQAMHCFERAGLNRKVEVSHTYYLREQARSMPVNASKQALSSRRMAFINTAEAFLRCSIAARGVKERKAYLRNAGDCYVHAQEDRRAADAYRQAEEYNTAVKLYRKCARFDEAVALVTQNGHDMDKDVVKNIIDVARLFFFKGGELEKAGQLFATIEEQLDYLEAFDLDISRAALLEKLGKFQEAAEIHLTEGRTQEAIRLLLLESSNPDSVSRATDCILRGLWEKLSFDMKDLDRIEGVVQLLEVASKVRQSNVSDPDVSDELSMFHFISKGDSRSLRTLGRKFASLHHLTSALLCFDHFFSSWPNMCNMTSAEISELLDDFHQYCGIVQQIARAPDAIHNPRILRLFGIDPSWNNVFFLRCGTFLYEKVIESRAKLESLNEQGVYVNEWELARRFRESLLERLHSRILTEAHLCAFDASAFHPCPSHITTSYCSNRECSRQHISTEMLTHDWYTLQVRIHLQQVLVIQTLPAFLLRRGERLKILRFWIGRLYETLYPVTYLLGGITSFDVTRSPEVRKAFAILRQWCLDVLHYPSHNHRTDLALLTTLYQVIKLLFHVDKENATRFLFQSRLIGSMSADSKFYRKVGDSASYVLHELVSTLASISYDSIGRGVLFVRHLLDNMLPLDATALCEMIEYLCGSIILIRNKLVLHNVSLPLSWFKSLLYRVSSDPGVRESDINPTLNTFVAMLRQLIDSMYTRKRDIGHLLVLAENSNIYHLAIHRNIYIARLCRSICILGYNVNNDALRSEIVKAMQSLKTVSRPHNLFKDFAHARDWYSLARLVQNSVVGPLDEMIQLYYESKVPGSKTPPGGVRRVVYKTFADIPRLLDNPRPTTISNLRATAPEFVPTPRVTGTLADDEGLAEQDIEEPEVDNTNIINSAHSAASIAVAALPKEADEPSLERIQAAIRIQTLYRKRMRLRRKIPKSALDASRHSCFELCLQESLKIEWPSGNFYRMLFLGPLPHVLASLNSAYVWVLQTKKRNKKRFTSAKHYDLEDINKRLTEQKKIIDRIQKLQRVLSPLSDLHRRRDVEELKRQVLEVDSFLKDKIPTVAQDVEGDMAIALKGIVTVKRAPKSNPKPQVRLDDDENSLSEPGDRDYFDFSRQSDGHVPHDHTSKKGNLQDHPNAKNISVNGANITAQGSTDVVIQSLHWVPMPRKPPFDSSVKPEKERPDASEPDDSTAQSLSWIPI